MTDDERRFLQSIVDVGGVAKPYQLPTATRDQDKARQKCRKAGWALAQAKRWHITDAGRAALSTPN